MNKRLLALLSLLLAAILAGCNTVPENTSSTPTSSSSALITQVTPPTGPVQQPASLEMGKYEDLGYMLYVPADPRDNLPMIVYLHNTGDQGNDPQVMLTHAGFPLFLISGQLGQVNAYVLMPQLGTNKHSWEQLPDELISLVDKIAAEKKVNTQKISLTGHGIGGTGVWRVATKYPEKFSCFVPMSGIVRYTDQNLSALESAHIWAFVGSADTVIDPASTTRFVDALKTSNSNCQVTILENVTHNQVPAAYHSSTYRVIQWMLSK